MLPQPGTTTNRLTIPNLREFTGIPSSGPLVPTPQAPGASPFSSLPNAMPGDPIRAEDFRKLSLALRIIFDAYALSSSLIGRSYSEARLALTTQQYQIRRVMTVFGTEIANPADTALDSHRVIHVIPVILGERSLDVILSEAVETRKFAPNLIGLTYQEAAEKLKAHLGDGPMIGTPPRVPELVNRTLREASQAISG
jgi:hypothetical protein